MLKTILIFHLLILSHLLVSCSHFPQRDIDFYWQKNRIGQEYIDKFFEFFVDATPQFYSQKRLEQIKSKFNEAHLKTLYSKQLAKLNDKQLKEFGQCLQEYDSSGPIAQFKSRFASADKPEKVEEYLSQMKDRPDHQDRIQLINRIIDEDDPQGNVSMFLSKILILASNLDQTEGIVEKINSVEIHLNLFYLMSTTYRLKSLSLKELQAYLNLSTNSSARCSYRYSDLLFGEVFNVVLDEIKNSYDNEELIKEVLKVI